MIADGLAGSEGRPLRESNLNVTLSVRLLLGSKSGIVNGTSRVVVNVPTPAAVQLMPYAQIESVNEYAGIAGEVPQVPDWLVCALKFQTRSVSCRSVWFGRSGECQVMATWPRKMLPSTGGVTAELNLIGSVPVFVSVSVIVSVSGLLP